MSSIITNKAKFADTEASTNSLEQLREILTGSQRREIEGRVSALEKKLETYFQQWKEESKKAFDKTELKFASELKAIEAALKEEQELRIRSSDQFRDQLVSVFEGMADKLKRTAEKSPVTLVSGKRSS